MASKRKKPEGKREGKRQASKKGKSPSPERTEPEEPAAAAASASPGTGPKPFIKEEKEQWNRFTTTILLGWPLTELYQHVRASSAISAEINHYLKGHHNKTASAATRGELQTAVTEVGKRSPAMRQYMLGLVPATALLPPAKPVAVRSWQPDEDQPINEFFATLAFPLRAEEVFTDAHAVLVQSLLVTLRKLGKATRGDIERMTKEEWKEATKTNPKFSGPVIATIQDKFSAAGIEQDRKGTEEIRKQLLYRRSLWTVWETWLVPGALVNIHMYASPFAVAPPVGRTPAEGKAFARARTAIQRFRKGIGFRLQGQIAGNDPIAGVGVRILNVPWLLEPAFLIFHFGPKEFQLDVPTDVAVQDRHATKITGHEIVGGCILPPAPMLVSLMAALRPGQHVRVERKRDSGNWVDGNITRNTSNAIFVRIPGNELRFPKSSAREYMCQLDSLRAEGGKGGGVEVEYRLPIVPSSAEQIARLHQAWTGFPSELGGIVAEYL